VPGHDRYGSGLRDRSADYERSRALARIPAAAPGRAWTRIDVGNDLHSGAGSRGLAGWVGGKLAGGCQARHSLIAVPGRAGKPD